MFVSGIETAARFTRPIHMIARVWGNAAVIPGAAYSLLRQCRRLGADLQARGQSTQIRRSASQEIRYF